MTGLPRVVRLPAIPCIFRSVAGSGDDNGGSRHRGSKRFSGNRHPSSRGSRHLLPRRQQPAYLANSARSARATGLPHDRNFRGFSRQNRGRTDPQKTACAPRLRSLRFVVVQCSVDVLGREIGIFLNDSVHRIAVFMQPPDRADCDPGSGDRPCVAPN